MVSAFLVGVGLLAVLSPDDAKPAPADETVKAYETARAEVGRDPKAHVKVALWCETHGMPAERLKHLAIAVMLDPRDALARGLMGVVAFGGQWKSPEAVSEKIRADQDLGARLAEYN